VKRLSGYLVLAIVAFLLARLAVLLIVRPEAREWVSPDFWRNAMRMSVVMHFIQAHYVDSEQADYDRLTDKALNEMLQSLDGYSDYLDANEITDFEITAEQQYAGIGVQIERLNRRITITEVFAGSPAIAAGLQPGDQIVRVGEEDTREMGLMEIVNLLRGPEDSMARLTLYRPATGKTLPAEVRRARIDYPTVHDVSLSPEGIGYLQLTQFSRRSSGEVATALDGLEAEGMRGLIIDLRNNPGGILPAAIDIAGAFLDKGTAIVTTRGRGGRLESTERSLQAPRPVDYPIAVLIDATSASASEIVAGALQDAGRAVIVGETSHGKGSVQSVLMMSDKAGLRMTTARYYLPSGRSIQDVGVEPDIPVPLTPEERLGLLTQRAYRHLSDAEFTEQFGVSRIPDVQRVVAESVLQGVLHFDDTPQP